MDPSPRLRAGIISLVAIAAIILGIAIAKHIGKPLPRGRRPLVIAVSPWPGFLPVVLAKEKGFFKGVDVEYRFGENSMQQMVEFGSGKYDGVGLALGSVIAIDSTKTGDRVILVTDQSDGGDAIVAQPFIKTVADLKGKRLAVSGANFGELFADYMLKSSGLKHDDVRWLTFSDDPLAVELFKTGRIDALQTWEPFLSQAVQAGGHVLFSSKDAPGLISDVLAFHDKTLRERPEEVRAFILGWFQAVDFWKEHPDEASKIIARALRRPPSTISLRGLKLMGKSENLQAFQKGRSMESIHWVVGLYVDYYTKAGIINSPVDIDAVLDPSFLPKP